MKLLHVISDPLPESLSVNKRIAYYLLESLQLADPELTIETVNLYENPPPFFDFQQFKKIWQASSDDSCNEAEHQEVCLEYLTGQAELFKTVELLIISGPVWNYNLPAIFKAWIDQIISPGFLYQFGAEGPEPLHRVKTIINIFSAGGMLSKHDTDKALFHLIHAPFKFIGIEDFEDLLIEGQEPSLYPDFMQREHLAKTTIDYVVKKRLLVKN